MNLLQLRRIGIIAVVLIFALGVMNSIAAEKVKYSDTRYWFSTKIEAIKVDDTEGHIIQISESKGVDIGRKWVGVTQNTYDLVKGNGTMRGYTTMMGADGKITGYYRQEAKVTTTLSPEGKPVMTAEGTFTMIKGVGEWAGFTGGGTFKHRMIGDGIFVMDWQGEWVKP